MTNGDSHMHLAYAWKTLIYEFVETKHNTKVLIIVYILLGVRSLANASRARQFNPLNPPGVGWVNFLFKVRVYPHMRAKFGRGPSRKIFYNI